MVFIGVLSFSTAKEQLKLATLTSLAAIGEFREGENFLYFEKLKNRTEDFDSDGFIRDSLETIANQQHTDITDIVKNL